MDELEKAIARLQQLGATKEEIAAYRAEHAAKIPAVASESTAVRPDYQVSRADAAERPGLLTKTLGTIAATGRDIPGVDVVQAGARSGVRTLLSKVTDAVEPETYREALENIHAGEDAAPAPVRFAARAAGGTLGLLATPGSALASGAAYGAAHGALKSDPDAGVGDRLVSGVTEGAIGGATGKVGELVAPVFRSLRAPRIDANIDARTVQRGLQADPHYDAFRNLGDLGSTPELKDILELPVVSRALQAVKGESPRLNKLPDTHADVLDAVYKRVGNKAWTTKMGYETGEARSALADAIEIAAQAKGGSYQKALDAFATPSDEIKAATRGKLALRNASNPYGTPDAKAPSESPSAFARWARGATEGERQAASEGVLGRLKDSPKLATLRMGSAGVPIPFPSRAVREAPGLLQALQQEDPFISALTRAFATQQAATIPDMKAIRRR